ncbi:hypothetical protein F4827_004685 [Paraburkholderia bannensis]|uniref:SRPBCC family protein n=1 Tax=Paraburkholderia bannensis TaxID=765414 RepID=A0A7W9WSZ8_9BURK|nr:MULTISPECIES: AtaL-like protein [Paraburkholderia]MBB3259870.1 hypothetical protein [Paraburkholderia sp. WP4_3_2]MBB6104820.1 hypothetical protein [Paraburkholderia bannensis]
MALAMHRTASTASPKILWELLLDKIESPERYVPDVTSAEILRRYADNAVERMMHGPGDPIHELIVWDARSMTIVFKLVDHPVYRGFVTNMILVTDSGCELDFTMNWQAKRGLDPADAPDWQAMLKVAVLKTIHMAESGFAGRQSD